MITSASAMNETKAYHYPIKLMGCAFVITAVHNNPQTAWDAIRAAVSEIKRIESLISSWKDTSQTGMINNMAGIAAVKVDQELLDLIQRSIKISQLTSGSFDISGTLSRYFWDFNNDKGKMLGEDKIHLLRTLIDYKNIEISNTERTIFLKKKNMKIGFGGIGKGYAAACAKKVMENMGIDSGLVNASGDLMCWGSPPNKKDWDVKIPDPKERTASLMTFTLPFGSVVTSGNHESFTLIDGVRYSHIIDPRTGYPVSHIQQVSIVSPDPEFADAMATALSVMSVEEGLNIVNRMNGIECIIIDEKDQIYYSNHFKEMILAKAA